MSWSDLMERADAKTEERRRLAELGAVEKHPAAAWMLWLCLGWVGAHRFYLRKHGWLMLAWLVGAMAILTPLLPNPETGPMVWLIGVLCWWVLDAFLLPGWIRGFQANHAAAAEQLEAEDMVQVLTIPIMRAAQKQGGRLTVPQAVVATGFTFTEVEKCLTEMAKTGYVKIENTDDGNLLFVFGDLPEFDEAEYEEALAEASALAMAEAADALAESAERVEDAERRSRSDSRGSSVLRGAVAGLTAFGLHSIFDDDE